MRTREQQIDRAAIAYVNARKSMAEMTPREQAEAAWSPTSRRSVDELEDLIRAQRGLPALQARKANKKGGGSS